MLESIGGTQNEKSFDEKVKEPSLEIIKEDTSISKPPPIKESKLILIEKRTPSWK